MGQWMIHVEGHGVHDNGLPHDAEERLRQFVEQMLADGHTIDKATIVVGSIREALELDGGVKLGYRQI